MMQKALLISGILLLWLTDATAQTIPKNSDGNKGVIQFTGTVADHLNKALPFATVLIRNRYRGTISNFYGFFSLPVRPGDTLVFSYVGYHKHQYVIPDTLADELYNERIILRQDTIMLPEAVIFPYATYEQFKRAFVTLDIPDDDLERANRNLVLIQIQAIANDLPADGSLAYDYIVQQNFENMYDYGQYPYVPMLNPFAWAKFFKALREGEFKTKDPEKSKDEFLREYKGGQ